MAVLYTNFWRHIAPRRRGGDSSRPLLSVSDRIINASLHRCNHSITKKATFAFQQIFLFDHLVGAGEQRRRHVEAKRRRGFHVEHRLSTQSRPCNLERLSLQVDSLVAPGCVELGAPNLVRALVLGPAEG